MKKQSRRSYRVVSTYDSYYVASYGLSTILHPHERSVSQRVTKVQDRRTRLPNAPMRAKETLLADCLKAGFPPTEFIRRERNSRLTPSPQQRKYLAKDHPDLKGKLLGIEIEFYPDEGFELPIESAILKCGTDGSLYSSGVEVRKVTWQNRDGRLAGILGLNLKGRVDNSCGLHVHVDARHIGDPEWCYDRVTECYEPLKLLVPSIRHSSKYCRWSNNREGSDYFVSGIGRYAAVNYYAYPEHGSFEFRCQCGMLKPLKIESWALVCQWLVNWCADDRNEPPTNWRSFLAIMPEPLRSWCALRAKTLHDIPPGEPAIIAKENPRTLSALDPEREYRPPTTTSTW